MQSCAWIARFSAILFTTAAWAADMQVSPLDPVIWKGLSVGISTGGVFTDRQRIITYGNDPFTVLNMQLRRRTPIIGTQYDGFAKFGLALGYDYPVNAMPGVVVGASADWTLTALNHHVLDLGEPVFPGTPRVPSAYRQRLEWIGNVTGRLGYSFDRLFFYGAAGFAYGEYGYHANFYNPIFANALAYRGDRSGIATGYAYGGGVEYAFHDTRFILFESPQIAPLTVKIEVLHYSIGSNDVFVGGGYLAASQGSYGARFESKGTLLKAGLTYRFNVF